VNEAGPGGDPVAAARGVSPEDSSRERLFLGKLWGRRKSEAGPDAGPGDDPTGIMAGAVDLGSNSFHMVIARFDGHDLEILDRIRDPVRIASGLENGDLTQEVQDRAIACLERFGERLRNVPPSQVRAVGTNTLRKATHAKQFRLAAERALGHPIEVISGQEEARLIYKGVSHSHPFEAARRLVLDIGGGSTEVIVGRDYDVLRSHSLYMGCVTFTQQFFSSGEIRREFFDHAQTSAELELQAVQRSLRGVGWDVAAGASGTVNAISELLRLNGWDGPEITLAKLKKLRKNLIKAGRADRLELAGLKPDRAPVLAAGLAILMAAFQSLKIASMMPSSGALREGVLYDLLARIRGSDVRDRTIRKLVHRYRVDIPQAERVANTAQLLLVGLRADGGLPEALDHKLLRWASLLHEIGLIVSHTGYHKHSAYLVANLDLPGFSADDQKLLATIIRNHRRRLAPETFGDLDPENARRALSLCVVLRLAILLNRSRSAESLPDLQLRHESDSLRLVFPQGWLAEHPLTQTDLQQESFYLRSVGVTFEPVETPVHEVQPSAGSA
jgi:exopolyphosphatase/guanosine-5'-triphosphate,3'-diphosphate pyrophosphatase